MDFNGTVRERLLMNIDFPKAPKRKPTKKEMKHFNKWVKYLSDSKLTKEEVYSRAASFTSQGRTDYYG